MIRARSISQRSVMWWAAERAAPANRFHSRVLSSLVSFAKPGRPLARPARKSTPRNQDRALRQFQPTLALIVFHAATSPGPRPRTSPAGPQRAGTYDLADAP